MLGAIGAPMAFARKLGRPLATGLCVVLLIVPALGAQGHTQSKREKEKPWKPAAVGADVLSYGAKLQETASPALKEWLAAHLQKNLREKAIDPKVTIDAVDARFPAAPDNVRDAAIYLVFFLAYHDDLENERVLLFRIREIDRETDELVRSTTKEWQREQNLAAAGRATVTPATLERREEAERKLNDRLRELRDERETKAGQLEFTRKKVNIYLKLLASAFPKLKGTDPAALAELK